MSPESQSPKPDFDFMLKDNQPLKRGLAMPNLPKPIKIVLLVILVLTLITVALSWLSGRNSGANQPIINAMARGSETLRITNLVQTQLPLQDSQTKALAATVSSSLSSDQAQLKAYMAKNNIKITPVLLAGLTDKTTDASLQSASQNNSLDSAYLQYLRDALAKYKEKLQIAYEAAGPNGKKILQETLDSTNTLLNTSPLKT